MNQSQVEMGKLSGACGENRMTGKSKEDMYGGHELWSGRGGQTQLFGVVWSLGENRRE